MATGNADLAVIRDGIERWRKNLDAYIQVRKDLEAARAEQDRQANLVKVLEDQFAMVGAAVDRVHAHLAGIDGDDAVIRVSDMRRFLSSVGLGASTPEAGAR